MEKIKFTPSSKLCEAVVSPPKPAKEYMPQWYKDKKVFNGGDPKFYQGQVINKSVKSCVPFFDGMTAGYIQETWCDIWFDFNEEAGTVEYHASRDPQILDMNYSKESRVPIPEEFYPFEFSWKTPWIPVTPKGYSILFTSPVNNLTLPFQGFSAVVDSDTFHHAYGGNYPFLIKKGFSGLIPEGTPMYQMIPIKRDDWESENERYDEEKYLKNHSQWSRNFWGTYKKRFHQKKSYN